MVLGSLYNSIMVSRAVNRPQNDIGKDLGPYIIAGRGVGFGKCIYIYRNMIIVLFYGEKP